MVFRSFAVVGPGNFGNFIIAELLKLKTVGTVSSVAVVSRSDASASHPEWAAHGAKFAIIEYNDRSTLLAAFEGVEVVISTVRGSPEAIRSQKALADAAQAVGVKIFVPSEFAGVATAPHAALKMKILDYLKEIGLPSVVFYTGAWADVTFGPLPGLNYVDGKVTVR